MSKKRQVAISGYIGPSRASLFGGSVCVRVRLCGLEMPLDGFSLGFFLGLGIWWSLDLVRLRQTYLSYLLCMYMCFVDFLQEFPSMPYSHLQDPINVAGNSVPRASLRSFGFDRFSFCKEDNHHGETSFRPDGTFQAG
jgi:hypothetical protein